jgi:Outer membrane protein beta-barrel domain
MNFELYQIKFKMKKIIVNSIFLIAFATSSVGQDSKANVGFGLGMDYGGIGGRITYIPINRIGLFAAAGFNLNSLGYNIGGQVRFPTEKKVDLYVAAMYGYNAVLIVTGDQSKKTTYYGPTVGAGLELKLGGSKTFLNFELLVPFRKSQYQKDIDALKASGATVSPVIPIGLSVGFHFRL